MTSFVDLALRHVSHGFYVFPAQQNKRPIVGLMDWEAQASLDPDQIRQWWESYPDALPAIAPGVSGHAVIDVDRHEDSADGFASLAKEQITLPEDAFTGTSLSGNGQHYWFSADVGSVNGVIPGVDRKSRGGYVIAPYELPHHRHPNPSAGKAVAGRLFSLTTRTFMTPEQLNYWMQTVGSGPIVEMERLVHSFEPKGNEQMSRVIARVVRRAAQGDSGASKALDKMLDVWLSVPHSTGDPEEEFHVNVKSAIEKFGEPVDDDEELRRFYEMANGEKPFEFNRADLAEALSVFCDSLDPDWRENEEAVAAIQKCRNLIPGITNAEGLEQWRTVTKQFMRQRLVDHG